MPLMVARHCSRVEKPQFLPPPSSAPPYWGHHGYSIPARVGVARVGTDAIAAIPMRAIQRIGPSSVRQTTQARSGRLALSVSWPQSFIN
jgi:TPP-dependent 2-oxoacid decarboxylase